NAGGYYGFSSLVADSYSIEVITPPGFNHSPQDVGASDETDSDVDETLGRTDLITLTGATSINNVDAGLFVSTNLGTIGDLVWSDFNGNGIRDAGEPGMEGVKVRLLDVNFATLRETTSDEFGRYAFSGLAAGDFLVEFETPSGFAYSFSPADQGLSDRIDSDPDISDGRVPVTLTAGEVYVSVYAGLVADPSSGAITGSVWEDLNGDGIQDINEPPRPGVAVWLYDSGGTELARHKSDRHGHYEFIGLPSGTYELRFDRPFGHAFSPRDVGTDDELDSDVDPVSGDVTIALGVAEVLADIDAGIVEDTNSSVISGSTFTDDNGDGIRTFGDGPLPGIDVKLFDAAGSTLLATTVSDARGDYRFGGLAAGNYLVEFATNIRGYDRTLMDQGVDDLADSDPDPMSGRAVVAVGAAEFNTSTDAGYVDARLGTITGRAWLDVDRFGIQGGWSVAGIEGIVVTLYDATGTRILGRQRTSGERGRFGYYRFSGLAAGTYLVHFGNLVGRSYTVPNAIADEHADSDADDITGIAVATISVAEVLVGVDAGYVYDSTGTGVIRGRIWNDINGDGIQDESEPGLDNAEGREVQIVGAVGSPVYLTSTVRDGEFEFRGLPAGSYDIVIPLLGIGLTQSPTDQGDDDTIDSDVGRSRRIRVTLGEGEIKDDVAAGYFYFANGEISGRVWEDLDGDGIQDPSEPSLSGVGVYVRRVDGRYYDYVTTDASGYRLRGLPPGEYKIGFSLNDRFAISPRDQGVDDTIDSDLPTYGFNWITIGLGETVQHYDVGLAENTGKVIGGRVWDDRDGDGFQDASEPNLPATVRLFPEHGDPVEIFTDTGFYRFGGLTEDRYYVVFPLPAGYSRSPRHAGGFHGSDPDEYGWVTVDFGASSSRVVDAGFFQDLPGVISGRVWDDLNANGIQDVGEPGLAGIPVNIKDLSGRVIASTISSDRIVGHTEPGYYRFGGLDDGTYIVSFGPTPDSYLFSPHDQGTDDTSDSDPIGRRVIVSVGIGEVKDDIDAGIYSTVVGGISGRVWDDRDGNGIQDSGERGIGGLVIHVFDGSSVRQVYTDAIDGFYSIRGLRPGTYTLQFSGPPGSSASPANQGTDDSIDSDAIGNRVTLTLGTGISATNVDAGFVEFAEAAVIAGRLWDDLNANGLQEPGEPNLRERQIVVLEDASGRRTFQYTDDGDYSFRGLAAGTYTLSTGLGIFGVAPSGSDQGISDLLDSDFGDGRAVVTVAAGEVHDAVDAGFVESTFGFISGRVWHDNDTDGIEDPEELGIGGVPVELRDLSGRVLATKFSADDDGEYRFGGLEAGVYMVVFGPGPSGYVRSPHDQGGDDRFDSDPIGRRVIVNLPVGGSTSDVDAGFYPSGSGGILWGRIWDDLDQDGIQDPGEPDRLGHQVYLTQDGRLVRYYTASTGHYRFEGLEPGEYSVSTDYRLGQFSPALNLGSNDEIDADFAVRTLISIAAGETIAHFDAGIYVPTNGSVSGRVWNDHNAN
ncbi:MAG: hypothetical protein KDB00_23995, partial [Planctomycetales bacterium]|nr:hypothetical protein [Planctomycetales bacterium]